MCFQALKDGMGCLVERLEKVRLDRSLLAFEVDFTKVTDKVALKQYSPILTQMLIQNPSCIYRKSILQIGIKRLDSEVGGSLFTKGRPDKLRSEAYSLQAMFLSLKDMARSSTTGARLPKFLADLICLIDIAYVKAEVKDEVKTEADCTDTEPDFSEECSLLYVFRFF